MLLHTHKIWFTVLEKPAGTYFHAVTSFFQGFTSSWHSFDPAWRVRGTFERGKNSGRALKLALPCVARQPNKREKKAGGSSFMSWLQRSWEEFCFGIVYSRTGNVLALGYWFWRGSINKWDFKNQGDIYPVTTAVYSIFLRHPHLKQVHCVKLCLCCLGYVTADACT